MELFSYPLDSRTLIRKKLQIRRELLASGGPFIDKRIAVLGGSTTDEIVDQLELFLLHHGIRPAFYQSAYGQYWQDAMFGNEELERFAPDAIYIHTSWRNITGFPSVTSTREEADALLDAEASRFERMWDRLAERFGCPIVQDSFDRPGWRLLGNSDISDHRGKTNFISRLDQRMYGYAGTHPGFYVNDVDYLAACYGLDAWSDPLYWHMYKYSLSLDAIPSLARSVADIIKSLYGRNKKVLVCDLDNTLWGGVVGEDGVEGIEIGPELPTGQIYSEFQRYLKELKSIGVLLAVNSKNDEKNAIAGLEHPDCPLKPEDFACIRANWEDKDRNMQSIAAELHLGTDSFVFADDSPAEREIVRRLDPGIAVPDLDRVEDYLRLLDRNGWFEVTQLSEDDLARAEMYRANARREELEQTAADRTAFLRSLRMRATIRPFEPICYRRIAQLTNKSNQFNLTTLRCSEGDIARMQASPDHICLYGRLEDRFGDNGVVSVTVGEKLGGELHMRLWLMSCRVLKRGMEEAMLDALAADARAAGLGAIVGYYLPTPKNGMVRDFYSRMGFGLVRANERQETVWRLELDSYEPKRPEIEIVR